MTIERHSSGSRFEALAGYSRAVADDLYVHVSGTVGVDAATGAIPEPIAEQMANIFIIIDAALARFGCDFSDVVRNRVFLASGQDLMQAVPLLKERFGAHPPANTTLVCAIPAPGARIEIEVTARRRA